MDDDSSDSTLSPDASSPRSMACMEVFEVEDYLAQLELRNGPDHDVLFQFGRRSIPCHRLVLQRRSDFFRKLFRTFSGATRIDVVGIDFELMNSLFNLLYFGYVTLESEYSYELLNLLDLFQVKERLETKIFETTLSPWEAYEYEGKVYEVKEAIFVIKRVHGPEDELHFVDSRNKFHSEPLILFPPHMAERKRMADRMRQNYIRSLQKRDAQRSEKKVRIGKRAPTKFVEPGQSTGFEKVDSASSNVANRSEGSSTVLKKVKDEPVSPEKEDSSTREFETESSVSNVANQSEKSTTVVKEEVVHVDGVCDINSNETWTAIKNDSKLKDGEIHNEIEIGGEVNLK